MNIAVIGSGNVGLTLAKGLSNAGHSVVVGVREPGGDKDGLKFVLVKDAVAASEVVIFAVPGNALLDAASGLDLGDRILIDVTNPIKADFSGRDDLERSPAEDLAVATGSTKVVKCFNTVGFNIMANPDFNGRKATMLYAGDDAASKSAVAGLAADLGFDPVDAGPLVQAKWLESLAWLWISMALKYGHGTDIAFIFEKR